MKKYILLTFLTFSTSTYAFELPSDDTLYTVGTLMIVADWAQTKQISRNPDRWDEINPILGEEPHPDRVDAYFAIATIGYNVVGRKFVNTPTKKVLYHGSIMLMQGWALTNNVSLGVRMKF